jgi:hypothetical protein
MEIRKTKLGDGHPDTLTSAASLALTYSKQGRWEEAEKLGLQVTEMSKEKLEPDHPNTLTVGESGQFIVLSEQNRDIDIPLQLSNGTTQSLCTLD